MEKAKGQKKQEQNISRYYQFQSKIYDLTRWTFLFGRRGVLKLLNFDKKQPFRLAEIGSGTGFNLDFLVKKYPNIELVGIDVSQDMMRIAKKKVNKFNNVFLHQEPYKESTTILKNDRPDAILFSYSLTMINPHWKELLYKAYDDLKDGGQLLVADFHDSRFPFFKKHMGNHHVRMDGHLLHELNKMDFKKTDPHVYSAYCGVWQYLVFSGVK